MSRVKGVSPRIRRVGCPPGKTVVVQLTRLVNAACGARGYGTPTRPPPVSTKVRGSRAWSGKQRLTTPCGRCSIDARLDPELLQDREGLAAGHSEW